jgi:hypothetical protein
MWEQRVLNKNNKKETEKQEEIVRENWYNKSENYWKVWKEMNKFFFHQLFFLHMLYSYSLLFIIARLFRLLLMVC